MINPKKIELLKEQLSSPLHSDYLIGLIKELNEAYKQANESYSTVSDKKECYFLPSREIIIEIVEELRSILFPGYFGPSDLDVETLSYELGLKIDKIFHPLNEQIKRGFCFTCKQQNKSELCKQYGEKALEITKSFLNRLPHIRNMLQMDIHAAYTGDPAATSPCETIFCYPGVFAITNYRIAHELNSLHVPLIPRIITEYAHNVTGIDIHPGAKIDECFFTDHGTGVVIGETCIIGKNVRVYQGVTLGAKSLSLDEQGKPVKGINRHPIVENNVIIYSGATILGRVRIGKGSVIGGNVWLTHSVAPGSRITQVESEKTMFQQGEGI